jgi:hypothetical protein
MSPQERIAMPALMEKIGERLLRSVVPDVTANAAPMCSRRRCDCRPNEINVIFLFERLCCGFVCSPCLPTGLC